LTLSQQTVSRIDLIAGLGIMLVELVIKRLLLMPKGEYGNVLLCCDKVRELFLSEDARSLGAEAIKIIFESFAAKLEVNNRLLIAHERLNDFLGRNQPCLVHVNLIEQKLNYHLLVLRNPHFLLVGRLILI